MSEALTAALGDAGIARLEGREGHFVEREGPLAGRAPAAARTGATLCLLHGEVRTTAELAAELGLEAGTPAAELVARGFERWGEDVLDRCVGAWALLLWDRQRQRGLVARDHVGHHSLFLTTASGGLAFASELRALIELLPVAPAPDQLAMAHWLARTRPPEGLTLLSGVTRLAPGHLLRFDGRGPEPAGHAYWRPSARRGAAADPAQAAVDLRAALEAAAGRALGAAQRPGVQLSGGLDSSVVAALAAPRGPRCYSSVFPDHPEVDESANVEATRRHLGLDGVSLAHTAGSALEPALAFQERTLMPSISPNLFVSAPLLNRAHADGVDVMLDGEGGDEMLGAVMYVIADRLRGGRPGQAVSLARRIPGMGADPRARWVRRALMRYGLRGALPPTLHAALIRARRSPRRATALLRPDLAAAHTASLDPWAFKRGDGPLWARWLVYTTTRGADALGVNDQIRGATSLHGVRSAHPLRDPRVLETMLSFDPAWSFDPVLDRPLARAAVQSELAPPLRSATGKPRFNVLLDEALNGPDRPALQALLANRGAHVRALVRPEALDQLLAGPLAGPATLEIWRLATLEAWIGAKT